jgi:hypothetical protein
MARVDNNDQSLRRGKLNKNDNVIYRIRNGKQQVYIAKENSFPPSKAQKTNRSLFGKVNAAVNIILSDPEQLKEWEARFAAQHEFDTVRKMVFASIREQLQNQLPKPKRKSDEPLVLPRGIRMRVKPFAELSTTELYEILKARQQALVVEPEKVFQDLDNIDYSATHMALFRRGQVIAYVRVYPGEDGIWHTDKLLGLNKGKEFVEALQEQAEAEAKRMG